MTNIIIIHFSSPLLEIENTTVLLNYFNKTFACISNDNRKYTLLEFNHTLRNIYCSLIYFRLQKTLYC